jgi:hypothetical protein
VLGAVLLWERQREDFSLHFAVDEGFGGQLCERLDRALLAFAVGRITLLVALAVSGIRRLLRLV